MPGRTEVKVALRIAIACMILPAAAPAQTAEPAATLGTIQVKNVGIAEIDLTHIKVSVNLTLVPAQSGTLVDMRLCSLHLNGLPVFAAPLNQEIVLRKGEATSLPPVFISALYRDLISVQPLQQMIERQSVHLQGEMVSGLQVGFLGKLALHSQHPRLLLPISQDVPVEIAGGPFARNLALGALSALDSGMADKSGAGQLLAVAKPDWIKDLETRAQADLFLVESIYSLQDGKTDYPVNFDALGFRASSGRVATTADVLEPWKYDAEFVSALKAGTVKLEKKSQNIRLQPLAKGNPILQLEAKEFTAEPQGTPLQDKLTTIEKGRNQVQLLRRASPSSFAVLSPQAAASSKGLAAAPAAVAALESWDQVAVFRLRVDPSSGDRYVETLQLGARRDGDAIHLTQPVDEAVFGSPIVTPEGVIGMVQDEQAGTFLPADLFAAAAPATH